MREIPKELIIDSVDSSVGAIIDLFEADLRPLGGNVLRFHSGVNALYLDVIWKGETYQAYPIVVEGFESRNEGTYARPTMTIANVSGVITGINSDFDDAIGVKITRRQVPVKNLDAANWPTGNSLADSTQEAVSYYLVEEMTEETFGQVTYSLSTPVDCDNAIIPGRTILADVCQWTYRGQGCGYSGGPVADERDRPTSNPDADRCSHRRSGCRLRHPRPQALPISCFPGSQKVV